MQRRVVLRNFGAAAASIAVLGGLRTIEGGLKMQLGLAGARALGMIPVASASSVTTRLVGSDLAALDDRAVAIFGGPAAHDGARIYVPAYTGEVEAWRTFTGGYVDLLARFPSSFSQTPSEAMLVATGRPDLFPDGWVAAAQFRDDGVYALNPDDEWVLSPDATQEKARHEQEMGHPVQITPDEGLTAAEMRQTTECSRGTAACVVGVAACHFVTRNTVKEASWVCGLVAGTCLNTVVKCA